MRHTQCIWFCAVRVDMCLTKQQCDEDICPQHLSTPQSEVPAVPQSLLTPGDTGVDLQCGESSAALDQLAHLYPGPCNLTASQIT